MELHKVLRKVMRVLKRRRRKLARKAYRGNIPVGRLEEVVREIRSEKRGVTVAEVSRRLGCHRYAFYKMLEAHPEIKGRYHALLEQYK